MSDGTRKNNGADQRDGSDPEGMDRDGGEREDQGREASMPGDEDLYTPQGGGGGTGSGPIQEVAVIRKSPESGPKEDQRQDVLRPREMTLPQVADRVSEEAVGDALGTPGVAEPGEEEGPSSFRLLMTLGVAGALAGAVLVFVFLWSQPKILAYEAMVLREAVTEVLHGPERFESLFVENGQLVPVSQVSEGVDTLDLDRVFLGYDESGRPVGFAMEAEGFGFQDIISLIFGYDPQENQVLGMKVLSHLETPGLGDKIVKDSAFVREFNGVVAPIDGVKPDRNTGDPDQVDMITGATISSEAVIEIINDRIAEMRGLVEAYQPAQGIPGVGAAEGDSGPGQARRGSGASGSQGDSGASGGGNHP